MKILIIFIGISIAALFVGSVSLSPTSWSVPAAGGTQAVTVTASSAELTWTATSESAWLSISPASGTGSGQGIGSGQGSGLGPGTGGGPGGGAYRPGAGITLPSVVREVKPAYTADAMRAKIQGSVWLECIVMPDGSVGETKVTRSLDPVFGLDQEAVKAAKQWRFQPGTRFGEPVVSVTSFAPSSRL